MSFRRRPVSLFFYHQMFQFFLLNLILVLVSSDDSLDTNYGAIPIISPDDACSEFSRPFYVTQSPGYIVSPKYDDTGLTSYPGNSLCLWTLVAPTGYVIQLRSLVINLGTSQHEASVMFYDGLTDGSALIDSVTGFGGGRNFRTPHDSLHIKFESGNIPQGVVNQHRGFKIYYEFIKASVTCSDEQVRCKNGQSCIDPEELCDTYDQCRDGTDEEGCDSSLYKEPECGLRSNVDSNVSLPSFDPLLLIVGGNAATQNSWPWVVSIRMVRNEPEGHSCGGTLITNQWVLSAAHCFLLDTNLNSYSISLGKFRRMIRDEKEFTRYPVKLVTYPGFNQSTRQDDLVLIKLNAPISPADNWVSPICLPTSELESDFVPGTMLTILGWGEVQLTRYPYILKEASIPLVDNAVCSDWLHKYFPNTMMCAGFEEGGSNTCEGDSGGPIMLYTQKKWTIVGVTSNGLPCCGCARQPGVYTRVLPFTKWINETIYQA